MEKQASIIVDGEHSNKIYDYLNEIQKGCKLGLINYNDIKIVCDGLMLAKGLRFKKMCGVIATVDLYAQIFPSDNCISESTHFKVECDGKSWKLINAYRDKVSDVIIHVQEMR